MTSETTPFYKKIWFQFVAVLTFLTLLAGLLSDGLNVMDRFNIPDDPKEDTIIKSNDQIIEDPSRKKDIIKKRIRYYMEGQVLNNATNEIGKVKLTLLEISAGKYKSVGAYSDGLIGSYEVYGELSAIEKEKGKPISLKGQILFEDFDFPGKYKATYEMFFNLNVGTNTATANYIIDEIPGTGWDQRKQTGTIKLIIIDKEFLVDE